MPRQKSVYKPKDKDALDQDEKSVILKGWMELRDAKRLKFGFKTA